MPLPSGLSAAYFNIQHSLLSIGPSRMMNNEQRMLNVEQNRHQP